MQHSLLFYWMPLYEMALAAALLHTANNLNSIPDLFWPDRGRKDTVLASVW